MPTKTITLNPRLEIWLRRKKLASAALTNMRVRVEFMKFMSRNALEYKKTHKKGIVDYNDFTNFLKTAEL